MGEPMYFIYNIIQDIAYYHFNVPHLSDFILVNQLDTGAICFPLNTPVKTDQGIVKIQNITRKNTINGLHVLGVTKIINESDDMIIFRKNCFGENIPSQNTMMTLNHGVFFGNDLIRAHKLVDNDKIYYKKVGRTIVYNVLLEKHSYMYINNMKVETLNNHDKMATSRNFISKNQ